MKIEISEKTSKFTYENPQWKIDCLPIFYPIFQVICHFIRLWKITPFSTTFFRFRGRESSPSPCGRRWIPLIGEIGFESTALGGQVLLYLLCLAKLNSKITSKALVNFKSLVAPSGKSL